MPWSGNLLLSYKLLSFLPVLMANEVMSRILKGQYIDTVKFKTFINLNNDIGMEIYNNNKKITIVFTNILL